MDEGAAPRRSADARGRSRVDRLLYGSTSARQVAGWAALPALAGVALLLAPGRVFSREMTWDLLYNLAGAWHLHHGQVAHVDFHTPLGALTFELTRVGFAIAGAVPQAALAGPLILLVPALAAAALAAARRLPLLPAVIFTVYVTLLIVMPANAGDHPNAYSLAMSYNRWGWSAVTILCLVLFVPPRPGGERRWLDPLIGGALLLFLFYLKFTYAVAGFGAVAAALVLMPHVRRHWPVWVAAAGAIIAVAVLPHNHAYLADIWMAAASGHARTDLSYQLLSVVANRGEFAINGVAVLCLVWLWQRGWAERAHVAASLVVLGLGVAVLSQNAQVGDMPVTMVSFFLIYRLLWPSPDGAVTLASPQAATVMMALLIWPALAVAAETATLSAYYRAASRTDRLVQATETNLRGLAVPADGRELEETLASGPYQVHSPLRDPPLRDPLTQHQYLRSLLEAAALFAGDDPPSRVLVLDQVNAMPFVLGYPPPRGGVLWLLPEERPRRAEEVFDDVDVVLVPKYSTLARSTVFALDTYGDYLSRSFPLRHDTASWMVLRRTRPSDGQ